MLAYLFCFLCFRWSACLLLLLKFQAMNLPWFCSYFCWCLPVCHFPLAPFLRTHLGIIKFLMYILPYAIILIIKVLLFARDHSSVFYPKVLIICFINSLGDEARNTFPWRFLIYQNTCLTLFHKSVIYTILVHKKMVQHLMQNWCFQVLLISIYNGME